MEDKPERTERKGRKEKRKKRETRNRKGPNFRRNCSNEQIVKLEKTFNHPTAYPVSRSSLYLCSAESTVVVPPGCSAGSRGSLESGLNKIIARILAESFVAWKIARPFLECPNVRELACNSEVSKSDAREVMQQVMHVRLPQTIRSEAFLS